MFGYTSALLMLALLSPAPAEAQALIIARDGSRAVRPAPAENFTGDVHVEMLFEAVDRVRRKWRIGDVRAREPARRGIRTREARS